MAQRDQTLVIKEIARSFLPGSKVVLFGSRARNEQGPLSDYDFLVITPRQITVKQKMHYQALLRKELAQHKIAADVIIQSKKEVLLKQHLIGHIVREAIKEGVDL
jgi:predicted nucleotidyltransferase